MSFVFYEWTRERKFTLHSEMKPGECSNANTRTCNGITNLPASKMASDDSEMKSSGPI